MTSPSARLSLLFSSLGHFYIHMFTAFYFTIVLRLEVAWGIPFHDLLELWFNTGSPFPLDGGTLRVGAWSRA